MRLAATASLFFVPICSIQLDINVDELKHHQLNRGTTRCTLGQAISGTDNRSDCFLVRQCGGAAKQPSERDDVLTHGRAGMHKRVGVINCGETCICVVVLPYDFGTKKKKR